MANSFYTAYKGVFSALKAVLDYVPAVPGVPGVSAHDGEPEIPEVPVVPESGVAKTVFASNQLIVMLNSLPRDKDQPFGCSQIHFARAFRKQRKRISSKLGNPRILKIRFHTLRHWKATT